ncbi:DUF1643 domain-containing protein [Tepidiphilus sp. J10]|uniref:DUF1643 domain-containing protein n=1 Tax=Tepidiphilus sp. J10 TaxID=2502185 RepID=UPI00115EEA28
MQTGAEFSPCKTYRYALWRRWSDAPPVLFVMLNPSTANESQDDPTIRRCISFAKQWGHGGIIVGNLFAFRSPYPTDLQTATDPIGPENNHWLERLAKQSTAVVGAWGNHGTLMNRGQEVAALFPSMLCLGLTKLGQPRHPLYVPATTSLTSVR